MKIAERALWGAAQGALAVAWALLVTRASADDRLIALDGTEQAATIRSIDAAGQATLEGGSPAISLEALRRVERSSVQPAPTKSPIVVHLAGGGKLFATGAVTREEKCLINWLPGDSLSLPLDAIRAIRWRAETSDRDQPQGSETFDRAVAATSESKDQLFAILDGRVQVVTGVFEELSADAVTFALNDGRKSVPRDKALGMVMAPVGKPPKHAGLCLVEMADGSSLWGRLAKLEEGQLSLVVADQTLALPWDSVMRLTIQSERLLYLSDIEPVEVSEQPLVTAALPWRRDSSVLGAPLQLAGKTYAKGLGVHAQSRLVFDNDGFDLLAATIGLDAETGGQGDCVFVVLADGREVFRQRMTGADKPIEVRTKLAGAKRVTLLVEVGEDLDLSDHADWCDVRLIREKK